MKNFPLAVYDIYEDEDYYITDPLGWTPALEQMHFYEKKIHLETRVTMIEYSAEGVVVHALKTSGNGTEEEVLFEGEYAICTFSLGVLQSQHEELFSPPLPEWKREEVGRI